MLYFARAGLLLINVLLGFQRQSRDHYQWLFWILASGFLSNTFIFHTLYCRRRRRTRRRLQWKVRESDFTPAPIALIIADYWWICTYTSLANTSLPTRAVTCVTKSSMEHLPYWNTLAQRIKRLNPLNWYVAPCHTALDFIVDINFSFMSFISLRQSNTWLHYLLPDLPVLQQLYLLIRLSLFTEFGW